jgi:hypothetical protein
MEKSFLSELSHYLLGDISGAAWVASLVFALTGVAISLLYSIDKRDKLSIRTPRKFSLLFLLSDNSHRIALNILLILVFLRFTPELIGKELTMWLALLVGLAFDRLASILREKKLIDKN